MKKRRATGTALAAIAVAGLASGCLSSNTSSGSSGGGAASGPGKTTVEIMYAFGNAQEVAFQKDVSEYAKSIGVTIKYTKAGSWDTEINARVSGGTPPDLGLFPQPGLMCDLAKEGDLQPYDDATVTTAKAGMVPGLVGAGTCADGKVYGLPTAVSVKSLLWYDQAAYKAAGVEVPKTLDQLTSVTDQLRSAGKTPWCIAAESGNATGWPITDWIEDLVLRIAGPDNYDKWVKGELKFNSPEIKPAFDYFQKIAFTDGNVRGGTKSIVATNFQTGGNGLFSTPPGCYLFKQATFISAKGGFPDSVIASLDSTVGVTAFPAKTEGDNPVEVGGDLAAAFSNDSNVAKIRDFIASKDNNKAMAPSDAGVFSPYKDFDSSLYPTKTLQTIAKDVLYTATAARFDGSDLMPAVVGAGTFWTEPVKWISGAEDETTMLNNIDASYPKS